MLINNLLDNIKKNISVRQNIIDLKNEIKDEKQKKTLAYQLAGDFSVFMGLLSHEDPKVRKNAVLIVGEMECDDGIDDIWNACLTDDTLFGKADYLRCLSLLECGELLPRFKERMKDLSETQIRDDEDKHIRSEMAALQKLIHRYEKKKNHRFNGYERAQTVILMTNRNHREVTAEKCDGDVKFLAGGIRVKTENLKELLQIRTYSEILFPIPGAVALAGTPEEMAKVITKNIVGFMQTNHQGNAPFFFRMELKGITDRDKKNALARKLSIAFEKESNRVLLNSTSDYEMEIRFLANKKGQYVPLLKLFTMEDDRFSYRKEVLPTSIAPFNAALMMELSKAYLREDAQVLDPFCGVGTMLIERCNLNKCGSVYGLDILEEAIEKARSNTELAHLPIHYINRDYFDFRHEYKFDEIITNMPSVSKTKGKEDIQALYQRFLKKSEELLKDNAVIVAYTTMPEILQEALKNHFKYEILDEFVINEREISICYVLRYRK